MSDSGTFYDLAIVGSGFGGSLLAMIARRLGLSVLLLERGQHPRFAIGESTSPLANLLLEEIARRYDLPRLLPLTAYGQWQRTYPDLGCGLKRGFSYFHHQAGQPYQRRPQRDNQLLVAASPSDSVADTHWLRADVDQFLLEEAIAAGADYRDTVTLAAPEWDTQGSAHLAWERGGKHKAARARFLIDATGPRGFLSRTLGIAEASFPHSPPTQALYTHFTDVHRWDSVPDFQHTDTPPYPVDDAALHHVFDGGWMWVLRVGKGLTSAGVALTEPLAQELHLSEGAPAWERVLARFPSIAVQFADARPVRPLISVPRLTYRASHAAGPGWVMLPSAAAFVDPLFSTGIPLTLLGIERLGRLLEDTWNTPTWNAALQDYSEITLAEADTIADFLSACYAALPDFPRFAALSMFYFAASSYSEMARRLGQRHRVSRFLASDHPQFGSALRRSTAQVREGSVLDDCAFAAQVADAIACLNIAGLCDPAKRNWYGVDLQDVVRGAAKLGQTPEEMQAILRDAPWARAE